MNDIIRYLKRHITRDQFQLLLDTGVPLTGQNGLRRWVAERDIEAFAKLYFENEFVLDFPAIHLRLFKDMQEFARRVRNGEPGLKLAYAIPRGHAKTALMSRILPLHGLLFGWSPLTVLLGNTQQASERLLVNVRTELETNEAIVEDFGYVRGDVWTQNHIQSATGAIRALGVGPVPQNLSAL